jgi:hypothetical protein
MMQKPPENFQEIFTFRLIKFLLINLFAFYRISVDYFENKTKNYKRYVKVVFCIFHNSPHSI